ncbi:hypothetical protein, partial [Xanthomonas hortorum]|uniref:hypothetical protein n=1 Tax=Xanthomonas hortorum TaxID=56454 RepID=UPI001E2B71E4
TLQLPQQPVTKTCLRAELALPANALICVPALLKSRIEADTSRPSAGRDVVLVRAAASISLASINA